MPRQCARGTDPRKAGSRRVVRELAATLASGSLLLGAAPRLAADEAAMTQATDTASAPQDKRYSEMSLEDLLKVRITSVAGVAASWFKSPAAIAVITGEDIRREGFQSIAEAFRAVPGMQVARTDSRQWAISARGFNGGFANKLLVLSDGRTIYDPRFAGVYWDIRDVMLEDLDRIEVIRGPGATLWGANAVNGVINITTKSAKETQGFYATLGGGTEERVFTSARYGGRLGDKTYYRVWGRYLDRDASVDNATGARAHDDWNLSRGGFRVDGEVSPGTSWLLDTEIYSSDRLGTATRQPIPGNLTFKTVVEDGAADGGHALFHFKSGEGQDSGLDLQGYFDRDHRLIYVGSRPRSDTYDLDARGHFKLGSRNVFLVGAGWRYTSDNMGAGPFLALVPARMVFRTTSGFLQDTIALPANLSLMIGSKFEHNDFTGFEYQPSARASWTPNDRQTVWAAVSRPVRTPSRSERNVDLVVSYIDAGIAQGRQPLGFYVPIKLLGNPATVSEEVSAYEAGYRSQLGDRVQVDVAAYSNRLSHLLTNQAQRFGLYGNLGSARNRGFELAATVRASDRLRFDAAYTYTDVKLNEKGLQLAPEDAPHMANLRAHWDAHKKLELDGAVYFTDALPNTTPTMKAHTRADLGVTWRPSDRVQVALWGQDLLQKSHPEFTGLFDPSLIALQRGAYLQVSVRK